MRTLLLLPALFFLTTVSHADSKTWIVGVPPGTTAQGLEGLLAGADITAQSRDPHHSVWCASHFAVCTVRIERNLGAARLARLPGIRYVERDQQLEQTQALPLDRTGTTDCTNLWELAAIRAEGAWAMAQGQSAPWVAVVDNGFRSTHEDILSSFAAQYDYSDFDNIAEVVPSGIPAHGTFVTDIIAGNGSNGAGRVGIAPHGRVYAAKIADSMGRIFTSTALVALNRIMDDAAMVRIVNYSIGGSAPQEGMREAIAAMRERILFVTSAGNCGGPDCGDANNDAFPFYPANYGLDNMISVAGSTENDGYNNWSHYGRTTVDIAAPGVSLCSAGIDSDDHYYLAAGTSYAAPIVAGVAALVLEAHPDLRPYELSRILRASARDTDAWATRVKSGGIVNAESAIQTPFPRMASPAEQVTAESGVSDVSFSLSNPGAAGDVCVLVTHPADVTASYASYGSTCLTRRSGADVTLPDGAPNPTNATTGFTLFCGTLAAHAAGDVHVELHHGAAGSARVTVRVVSTSPMNVYLNAPYREGIADPSDRAAYHVTASATQSASSPDAMLGACRPIDTDAGVDAGVDAGPDASLDASMDAGLSDVGVGDAGPPASTQTGCACTTTSGSGPSALLLLALLANIRRKRRGLPQ